MSTDVRATFTGAADCFADTVGRIPATAWDSPRLGDCFQLTVHTLDIAGACGLVVAPPAQAPADALPLAVELAQLRGDGPTVLLGLTGRQALPDKYSVL